MTENVKIYCANCKFFDDRATTGKNWGMCRRYAPKPSSQNREKSRFMDFPYVHVDEFCGEFEVNTNLKEYFNPETIHDED